MKKHILMWFVKKKMQHGTLLKVNKKALLIIFQWQHALLCFLHKEYILQQIMAGCTN